MDIQSEYCNLVALWAAGKAMGTEHTRGAAQLICPKDRGSTAHLQSSIRGAKEKSALLKW